MDETLKAVLLVMVGAVLTFGAGELKSMRDEQRRSQREWTDRQREVSRRWIRETREFLSADLDAMERHVANGLNVLRPRQSSYPMATHALLSQDVHGWLSGLRSRVWASVPGGRDGGLLSEIEAMRDRCMRELVMQEIRVEADQTVLTSGGPPTEEELAIAYGVEPSERTR